jgi:hypothetical protein
MSNAFLPSAYDELTQRLVLGLEPLDAARRSMIARPIDVRLDGMPEPPPLRRRRTGWLAYETAHVPPRLRAERPLPIERHDSCRHVLRYRPTSADHVDVRLTDPERRFVPRRLRLPIVRKSDDPDRFPVGHRVRRPALFPGAAYDVGEAVTGLRGRALRSQNPDVPLRWARVRAWLPGGANGLTVGYAHGDERGEFLLLLGLLAAVGAPPAGDLTSPVAVRLTLFGEAVPPPPAPPDVARRDPLWDLPLEIAPAAGTDDDISPGLTPPAGWVSAPSGDPLLDFKTVDFVLGRTLTERDGIGPFLFVP